MLRLFVVVVENGKQPHQGKWYELDEEDKDKLLEQLGLEEDDRRAA